MNAPAQGRRVEGANHGVWRDAADHTPSTPPSKIIDSIVWSVAAFLAAFGIWSPRLSRALDRAVIRQELRNGR